MRIIEERVLYEESWLLLKQKRYLDTTGAERCWSYVERRSQREAAVIVAKTGQSGALVLIEQFRIPLERLVLEFPAGLIDPGETPEQAARRELAEETGYSGRIIRVGPGVSSTAGLSTEIVHMVYMEVAERPTQQTRHERSERIRVLTLRGEEYAGFLATCEAEDRIMDAKLYTYLREHCGGNQE